MTVLQSNPNPDQNPNGDETKTLLFKFITTISLIANLAAILLPKFHPELVHNIINLLANGSH